MATAINAVEIPLSVTGIVSSGSYTVPANRYAIVRAQVTLGGSFSIGGFTVLRSDTWTVQRVSSSPKMYPGASSYGSGSPAPYAGGLVVANGASGTTITNIATPTNAVDAYANSNAMTSDTGIFKVPPGTAMSLSTGGGVFIELYKVPGSST